MLRSSTGFTRCGWRLRIRRDDRFGGHGQRDDVTYQIVGDDEADIKEVKISISSPISRALIGKYPGDVAEVMAPGGLREYEILDVKYVYIAIS